LIVNASCDQLTVQTSSVSPTMYDLEFGTWQDPAVPCVEEPTAREFNTIIFAPSVGVNFVASMNGANFPIAVIPRVAATSTVL
jgi:hypothetical protein